MASLTSMSVCRDGVSSAAWSHKGEASKWWQMRSFKCLCIITSEQAPLKRGKTCDSLSNLQHKQPKVAETEEWEEIGDTPQRRTCWVTVGERPDNRLAVCILMLPGCLPHLSWTERGIVWIKNPLKDKRLMSQSWMMTTKNDSLLPWMHAQDFPSTPAIFNPPSSPVHNYQTKVTVSWDGLQWRTAVFY